jgi:hypothetical protein
MRIFDDSGLMVFPSDAMRELRTSSQMVVIKACFCPRGHNLINERAQFSDFGGILLRVRGEEMREGLVALSPIFGDKNRISLGIELIKGMVMTLLCPECGIPIPVYDECSCGADVLALFTRPVPDYGNCVGICNRVGCYNAELKNGNELLTLAQFEKPAP